MIVFKIIGILLFLVLLTLTNITIFKLVLYLKKSHIYNSNSLIFPCIFNSIQTFIILVFANHLITNVLEINITDKNIYLSFKEYIFPILLITLGMILLFISFQVISYMLINKAHTGFRKKYDPYSYYETSLVPYSYSKDISLYESLLLSLMSFIITLLPFSFTLVIGVKIFSVFN